MLIDEIQLHEGASNAVLKIFLREPSMEGHYPAKRPAMLIIPGGAYMGYSEKEEEPVAMEFLSQGFQVFILNYSIGFGFANFPIPFIEAAQAVKLIRENAGHWHIESDKIFLCGFSTGGHVAATLAVDWQEAYFAEALKVENNIFKPNALILGYPLLDIEKFKANNENNPEMAPILEMMFISVFGTANPSKEQMAKWQCTSKITEQMPPTFLWTTSEDALISVEESLDFTKFLAAHNVPFEYHIFQKGAHGLSLGNQEVGYTEDVQKRHGNAVKWVEMAVNWVKNL